MVKQLMSNNNNVPIRDCDTSTGSESCLRYQACEPGLDEVGTCEPAGQNMVAAAGGSEWAMLDRLVTSNDHELAGHGHEDSSTKGVRFHQVDANASSASDQINNPHHHHELSLRGEMDFWGYGK